MAFDIGTIVVIYFAALAWGSNEPWAMALIAAWSVALLAGRFLWDLWHGGLRTPRNWGLVPVALFIAYVALQFLSPYVGLDSPSPFRPHSVEPHSTAVYGLLSLAYFCLIVQTAIGFRSRESVKWLIFSILGLGVFEALYGLVQYFGGYNYIWDFQTTQYNDLAHGTIINRNHFALVMNIIISCGVGYLYYRSVRLLRGRDLSLRHVTAAQGSGHLAWVTLWLGLMGLAVVFSMSRMGIMAMICCLLVMIVLGKSPDEGKRTTVIGVSLLAIILGLALYTGVDAVLARYEAMTQAGYFEKDRVPLWRDSARMMQNQMTFGRGLGSFQWTFPAYEKLQPDVPARYAHNDYIQAVAEVGWVGLFLLVTAFVLCWKTAFNNLRRAHDPLVRGIGLATVGALTATGLQEITDFSLYIPGVAVLFAVLVGLNLRASSLNDRVHAASI